MPRHQYKRKTASPDSVYKSYEVSKLINYIMKDGKKTVAEQLVYSMLESIKTEDNDPLVTLSKAISNVTPDKEVRPRRLGGASYLVPTDIREDRKRTHRFNFKDKRENKRSYEKMNLIKVRDILGNEVFKDKETGKEYLMDFVQNKLIELKD